jgi:hypothetical protein
MIYPTNIFDYLERTRAEPPPVDPDSLNEALSKVEWVDSVEEAVKVITKNDQ